MDARDQGRVIFSAGYGREWAEATASAIQDNIRQDRPMREGFADARARTASAVFKFPQIGFQFGNLSRSRWNKEMTRPGYRSPSSASPAPTGRTLQLYRRQRGIRIIKN